MGKNIGWYDYWECFWCIFFDWWISKFGLLELVFEWRDWVIWWVILWGFNFDCYFGSWLVVGGGKIFGGFCYGLCVNGSLCIDFVLRD